MKYPLFENAFKFAAIGMALISPEGRWLKVNQAVLNLLGYTEEEILALDFLVMTHPEDLKVDLDLCEELLSGKRETFQLEKRYIHKQGQIIHSVLSVSLIRYDDGTPRFFISQIQDASELKITQQKMQHNYKMAALGEMASGIAHEINNPVTILNLQAEALNQLLQETQINRELAQSFVAKIATTVERIGSIVSSLKNFSYESKPTDKHQAHLLSSIVKDTLELCPDKIEKTGVKFSQDVPEDLLFYCNPVEISQVLLNLINNSFYAVKDLAEKEISLKVVVSKNNFDIIVTDSGAGVSESIRSNILKPFFTTKPMGEGTGLGLYISKEIVKAHQGELFLDELNPKTSFVVRLPLKLV